jgi:hypothetical protein
MVNLHSTRVMVSLDTRPRLFRQMRFRGRFQGVLFYGWADRAMLLLLHMLLFSLLFSR